MDFSQYTHKIQLLSSSISQIEGKIDFIKKQLNETVAMVADAKKKDLMQPLVLATLESLQKNEYEMSIGVFEKLLTALTSDVLPHSDKSIKLDLYTSHGSPALDIEVRSPNKNIESITSGAMLNTLSVGLRMIAIARTKQRRFLVLDEPDHWIRTDTVPLFINVLEKVISELGFQILIISHHPSSFFNKVANCITLHKEGSCIKVTGDLHIEPHQGLQAIRLFNFESHKDTIIPLHKGMTVLNGENFIGKSSFVRGLKAILEGESIKDSSISHDPKEESHCRVEVKVNDNEWIGWRRTRKLTATMRHKNRFYLRQDCINSEDEHLYDSAEDTTDSIPHFIQSKANIFYSQWSIHLAEQEESVFLLKKNTKPSERAKILALGSDTEILNKMIEKNNQLTRKNREMIREGEKYVDKNLSILKNLHGIDGLRKQIDSLLSLTSKFNENERELIKLNDWIDRYQLYENTKNIYKVQSLIRIPTCDKPVNLLPLETVIKQLHFIKKWSQVPPSPIIDIPKINDLSGIDRTIDSLRIWGKKSIGITVFIPEKVQLNQFNNQLVKEIQNAKHAVLESTKEVDRLNKELEEHDKLLSSIPIERCDKCGSILEHHH